MTDRLSLAARVETATGPDRELDCLIWCHVKGLTPEWQGNCLVAGEEGVIGGIDPGEHQRNFSCNRADQGYLGIPAYTASLDAAMTLVPKRYRKDISMNVSPMSVDMGGRDFKVFVGGHKNRGSGRTFALAITAACLRALSADPSAST